MLKTIIFPSSYFDRKQVDEDLRKEYCAAKECGLYNKIYIFSYESWFREKHLVLDTFPEKRITAAYRG